MVSEEKHWYLVVVVVVVEVVIRVDARPDVVVQNHRHSDLTPIQRWIMIVIAMMMTHNKNISVMTRMSTTRDRGQMTIEDQIIMMTIIDIEVVEEVMKERIDIETVAAEETKAMVLVREVPLIEEAVVVIEIEDKQQLPIRA